MRDYTIQKYKQLILTLQAQGYCFKTYTEFLAPPLTLETTEKIIVLRHDVDLLPNNSLKFAVIQAELNIKGLYYFRAVPKSWDDKIIKEISGLGHEVGYHYENMDTCKGDLDKAWDDFRYNLDRLRSLVDVKTICMHGSPRSKYDNKALWSKYNYKSLAIIGEPYFNINFHEVLYLSDTGRCWDGWKVSVRDKVPHQENWTKQGLVFHSTNNIIKAVEEGSLPDKIMMTFHPQRWNDNPITWAQELVCQNIKNQGKRIFISLRKG